jgi:WD40 repeat protein
MFGSGARGGRLAKIEYELHDDIVLTSAVWSPDGKLNAASTNELNWIHVWNVKSRTIAAKFQRRIGPVDFHSLAWSADGLYLATCGYKGEIQLFNVGTWTLAKVITPDNHVRCRNLSFSDDGKQLAVLGHAISIYSTGDWSRVKFVDLQQPWAFARPIRAIGYIPFTRTLLIAGDDSANDDRRNHRVGHIWELRESDTEPRRKFAAYTEHPPDLPAGVTSLAISPDGTEVATGTETGNGRPTRYVVDSVHVLRIEDGARLGAPLDNQGYSTPNRAAVYARRKIPDCRARW